MKTVAAYHHLPEPPPSNFGPGFKPWIFEGLWCRCGDRHYQGVAYYVTVRRDDGDVRALAGPYPEHYEALAMLPRATQLAYELDARAPWYSYGTAAMHNYREPGILNARLAAPPSESAPIRQRRRRAQKMAA